MHMSVPVCAWVWYLRPVVILLTKLWVGDGGTGGSDLGVILMISIPHVTTKF